MIKRLAGAHVVCDSLVREGVKVIFGIPGGGAIHLYHALPDYPIRHVLMRHEQSAAHAADGYARAAGEVGVCFATSGSGATNLLTGLFTALRGSSPMVAITGQAPSSVLGTDAFQEVDIFTIAAPATKHNYLVTDAQELPRVMRDAFHIARTGPPGPVRVSVTSDCQATAIEYVHPTDPDLRLHPLDHESDGYPLFAGPGRVVDSEEGVEPAGENGAARTAGDAVAQTVIRKIRHAAQGDVLIVTDLGQAEMREGPFAVGSFRPHSTASLGQGTPASALPAAIGAQLGCPEIPMWVIVAGESFQASIKELATIVQEQLPIKIGTVNGGSFADSLLRGNGGLTSIVSGPNYPMVANSYGISSLTVRHTREVEVAIKEAMAREGSVVVDFVDLCADR